MDGDPTVEPELDPFSLVLPLPYRVSIIIVLGVWAWGVNLHYLSKLRIDVPALIRYPARPSHSHPPHYLSTYRLAAVLTIPLGISLVLFWLLTRGQVSLALRWQFLPVLFLVYLFISFILPLRQISLNGRYRFLSTLRRVSIGGIANAAEGKFGDILVADVLTSYAKVLGDLFVVFCMVFTGQYSTAKPDRSCGGNYAVPILISIPSLIRFRQCIIEYFRVRKNIKTGVRDTKGWGGQHLANALKYASALPVILLSALQRGYDPSHIGLTETAIFRLWMFFVFVNSLYSFYWDVAKDWDLNLFSTNARRRLPPINPITKKPEYPFGLRRYRYFLNDSTYYLVIFIDLLLRFTWSFKLSPHLDHFNNLEGGIFVMQLLEVFRRWVWIFFRVETEWVRSQEKGPALDDILLGNHGSRHDDDDQYVE